MLDIRAATALLLMGCNIDSSSSESTLQTDRQTALRSTLSLKRLGIDYCAEDVGWEWGCEGEELSVVWVLLGEDYFSCGVSPVIEGIRQERPFEGELEVPATMEFGRVPRRLHLFTTMLEIDTGGPSPRQSIAGLEVALAAAYTVMGHELRLLRPASINELREMFLFALRMSSGENDGSVFSHAEIRGDNGAADVIVKHWPSGSFYLKFRINEH